MSNARHTPGPWKAAAFSSVVGCPITAGSPANVIASTINIAGKENTEANARLIAESTELLRVLETLTNELQVWYSSGEPRPAEWANSRIRRARAAIRKAKEGQ